KLYSYNMTSSTSYAPVFYWSSTTAFINTTSSWSAKQAFVVSFGSALTDTASKNARSHKCTIAVRNAN
ncbi:MAG: hypothetical protein PHX20_07075, partial [Candidatus Omnitrophica bacterium]|nr:hypothetical protein [Candidatus Omnitrophota bacterium]